MSKLNVGHISTFSPTQCGIATYTEDLIDHLLGFAHSQKVRLIHRHETSSSSNEGAIVIEDKRSYEKAIDAVNESNLDVVSLQHEFGIYGGEDGEYVTLLLDRIRHPVVTTLHTVSKGLPSTGALGQKVLREVVQLSDSVVVLSEESKHILISDYGANGDRVYVIRHGIPSVEFVYPQSTKLRERLKSALVFISAGHLRPSKGYDIALRALAQFKQSFPDFIYLIVGSAQSQLAEGSTVRAELMTQIEALDLKDNVVWVYEYLALDTLLEHILASDIGLVTYTEEEQNSSGIMPIFLGCGRPVVATRFEYALSAKRVVDGIEIAEIRDPDDLCNRLLDLIHNKNLKEIMRTNYEATRPWLWSHAAEHYFDVLKAVASH